MKINSRKCELRYSARCFVCFDATHSFEAI